jgi:type II secretory pathway component HofQ
MNDLFIKAFLATFLVSSAQAGEPTSSDGACCDHERFEKTSEVARLSGETLYTGQRISLEFKDADIVNVLRMLSEVGGENVVITDDVKGRITLRLVDVPWDEAFDVVLQMSGLRCVRIGNLPPVSAISGLREE